MGVGVSGATGLGAGRAAGGGALRGTAAARHELDRDTVAGGTDLLVVDDEDGLAVLDREVVELRELGELALLETVDEGGEALGGCCSRGVAGVAVPSIT